MNKRWQTIISDQSGAIAVMAVLLLTALLSAAALGVDYGYMAWVQNDLKKAAEAGALAGANALGTVSNPSWSVGQTKATSIVKENSVAGQLLTDCTVTYGYWSKLSHTLQGSTITPTSNDIPAVKVVVAKRSGNNGGPLQLFFASILPGVGPTKDLSGTAVAIIKSNGSSGGGGGWGILEIGNGNVNISGNVAVNGNVGVNGNGKVTISGSSGITGNLWVNGNGNVDLSGTAYVNGSLWDKGTGKFSMAGSASVKGTAYLDSPGNDSYGWSTTINGHTAQNNGSGFQSGDINSDTSGTVAAVQPYAQQALTEYNDFTARTATNTINVINNTANWNEPVRTISSTGAQTVVNLTSLNISSDGNLTLNGSATDTFIINVAGNFSLSGSGGIYLSGGLIADNVTFVHQGTQTVSVGAGTAMQGSILSPTGAINFSGNAAYNGTLISGKDITLSGSVHSPEKLSWLDPSGGSGSSQGAALVQ